MLAALQALQRQFKEVLVRHDAHPQKVQAVLEAAAARGVPIRRVSADELNALAHGETHGGVVAVCSPKPLTTPDELLAELRKFRQPPLLLLIEGIDDARNLGFVLRTAHAVGVHAVLIKKHLWDFDEVEIARPASGAYEWLPLVQIETIDPLLALKKAGLVLVACVAAAKRTMYDVDLTRPTVLVIGGEKRGVSGAVRALCDTFMTIPTTRTSSSLSLSHAAAIVMAETQRQRTRSP